MMLLLSSVFIVSLWFTLERSYSFARINQAADLRVSK
jgi:hypothetical protein